MCTLGLLAACGQESVGPESSNPLSGTFAGDVTVSRGSQDVVELISLSMTANSAFGGTFFRHSDGAVGAITGTSAGSSASVSGTIAGYCPGSFDGSVVLEGAGVTFSVQGSDCVSSFNAVGGLPRVSCINLEGFHAVSESLTVTCTAGGQSETQTQAGSGVIELRQAGCNVSYDVPGIGISRQGTIAGNELTFSGEFAAAVGGGVSFSENRMEATVDISDHYDFAFSGSGTARGTVDGVSFSCSGTSEGRLTRSFGVAVPVLEGGPIETFLPSNPALPAMSRQAIDVDSARVISHVFPPGSDPGNDQLSRVDRWLDQVSGIQPNSIVIVGYSLGGNAARHAPFGNMCSRITIDPVDDLLVAQRVLDQRFEPARVWFPTGRMINRLAEDTWLGIRGFRLRNPTSEIEIPGTNHKDIPQEVLASRVVASEVMRCLGQGITPSRRSAWHGDTAPRIQLARSAFDGVFVSDDANR